MDVERGYQQSKMPLGIVYIEFTATSPELLYVPITMCRGAR